MPVLPQRGRARSFLLLLALHFVCGPLSALAADGQAAPLRPSSTISGFLEMRGAHGSGYGLVEADFKALDVDDLDNPIDLVAVPEPATWCGLLMLLGFLGWKRVPR